MRVTSNLSRRLALLERPDAADEPRLLLVLRADRPDDDLVALGDFERLPGESVDALKARIERQHCAGLLILQAHYSATVA
jgi:hypothetical protein